MPAGIEAGAGQDGVHLAPQIGDGAHRARIGRRGKQADDARFADEMAICIEALDPDVIEIDAPVHARAHIRLGDDQRLWLFQEGANLRRDGDRLIVTPQHLQVLRAQDAERAVRHRLKIAILAAENVIANANEGEVAGDQPLQELDRLRDFLHQDGRRIAFQVGDDVGDPMQHRPPVLHGQAHLAEHLLDRLHDLGTFGLIANRRDMDLHDAFTQRAFARRTPLPRRRRDGLPRRAAP